MKAGSKDEQIIRDIKKQVINLARKNRVGHVPSSFSSLEILYTLYDRIVNINKNNINEIDRDKVIVSKEHCKLGLIFVLAHFGLLPIETTDKWIYNEGVTGHDIFREVASPELAAIDVSYGSLGQGIGLGIGLALANPKNHIYVIVGDGELQEGSCWEAFMFLGHNKIKNITIIVDRNNIQGGGYTKDIIDSSSRAVEEISSFNLDVIEVDGHNISALEEAFKRETQLPKCIVANTIKGKECLFVTEKHSFEYLHFHAFTDEEFDTVLENIDK